MERIKSLTHVLARGRIAAPMEQHNRHTVMASATRGWDHKIPSWAHTPYSNEPTHLETRRLGLLHVVPPLAEREDCPSEGWSPVSLLGRIPLSSSPAGDSEVYQHLRVFMFIRSKDGASLVRRFGYPPVSAEGSNPYSSNFLKKVLPYSR